MNIQGNRGEGENQKKRGGGERKENREGKNGRKEGRREQEG